MSRHQYHSSETVISHRFEIRSNPHLFFLLVKTACTRDKPSVYPHRVLELSDRKPSVILTIFGECFFTLVEERATVRGKGLSTSSPPSITSASLN